MIALEVKLNGNLVAVAGREDLCVLNTIVGALGVLGSKSAGTRAKKDSYELNLSISGLSAESHEDPGQHLNWNSKTTINVGDEVSICVVDVECADPPYEEKERGPVDINKRERLNWERAKEHYFKYREKYESDNA